MNAVCPKLYNPKAFKQTILAGLLACSILDAFPFPIGTVAFGVIEDTFEAYSSGVCSGFSPDSLFTHHPQDLRRQAPKSRANLQTIFEYASKISAKLQK